MRILLLLNKPNREIPIMESIRRELLVLDPRCDVKICEMCTPEFGGFVFSFQPDVVLTFPFTCTGFSAIFYLVKKRFGSKIVSFRAEGVVNLLSEINIACSAGYDSYGSSLVDYEIFWGSETAESIGRMLVTQGKLDSMDRVKVTGYPRLERYFSLDNLSDIKLPFRLKDIMQRYPRDKILFFVTGFHWSDYTIKDLFNARDLDAENNSERLMEAVSISKQIRRAWIENILKMAEAHRDALFVVKKHPIEAAEKYGDFRSKDNILFVHEDIEINEVMSHVGIFFHYGSTALVDAYLSKIPSVYVYSDDDRGWYSDLGWPSTKKTSLRDVQSVVSDFLNGNVAFENSKDILGLLKRVFNVDPSRAYHPSRDIAELLLNGKHTQYISWLDPFLWRAAFRVSSSIVRGRLRIRTRIIEMIGTIKAWCI